MSKLMPLLAAAAFLPLAGCSTSQTEASAEQEARVPFLHIGQARRFRAIDRDTVYIQGSGRRWYRAELLGPCSNLPWARQIGVDTRGSSTLSSSSTLIVDGERCTIRSLVASEPPPRRGEQDQDQR